MIKSNLGEKGLISQGSVYLQYIYQLPTINQVRKVYKIKMHRPKCIGPLGFETLPIRHKNNNSTDKGQEISEDFFLVFNCSEKQKTQFLP